MSALALEKSNNEVKARPHLGIVIVGHVDAGKSTTTGHLLFKLGKMDQRVLTKLKEEAAQLGKQSFEFAFFMDKQKEERARGVTISCTTKEFFTEPSENNDTGYHYTIIDAPGHKDFIKNMITGASQADVCLLMVPATKGSFEVSIQKANHKEGKVQGQTRQHAKLCNLIGIKQMIVGVNKMDGANYSEERYNEIKSEVTKMLKDIGWKPKQIAFIPMSGLQGENLDHVSDKMPWYKGFEVNISKGVTRKGHTLIDALSNVVQVPKKKENVPFRMPVSDVLKIPGVGTVITGRIEQGQLKKGQVIHFAPRGVSGQVFSIEMHHRQVEVANAGDNVGISVKKLPAENMPKKGDVIFIENDPHANGVTPAPVKSFDAMVFVQDHPGELSAAKLDKDGNPGLGGWTPSIHVRTAHAACRLVKIHWKKGKSTKNVQVDNPLFLKSGDSALVTMEPKKETPLFLDTFDVCEGLSRIAGMDSKTLIMLGKVEKVTYKS